MSQRVPLLDLKSQYQRYKADLDAAVFRVLDHGGFIGGPEVEAFETAFADYCGTKHAIGVANGTVALVVALKALGLEAGDEVIVPAHTFVASASAVVLAGGRPVFVDVEPETFTVDPARLRDAVGPRTRGLIAVDIYGNPCRYEELESLTRELDLFLLEDAAQAQGASLGGRKAGSFGEIATFSFYPGKNLGAYGDAGAITTDSDELATFCRKYRNHGRAQKYTHDFVGTNNRIDTIQAAVLGVKLQHLDAWNDIRRARALEYNRQLSGLPGLEVPTIDAEPEPRRQVVHIYPLQVTDGRRDELLGAIKERGIGAGIHYPIPLHKQPCFHDENSRVAGSLDVSERIASRELSLPLGPELTEEKQQVVVDTLKDLL